MILFLGLLGLCLFLSAKQERFIGNLMLSDDAGRVFFIPNSLLKQAHLLVFSLVVFAYYWATPELQSWLMFTCGGLALARLHTWHYALLWHNPFVILYYLALLSHGLVFLWWGWHLQKQSFSPPLADMLVLILTSYWLVVTAIWWFVWAKK